MTAVCTHSSWAYFYRIKHFAEIHPLIMLLRTPWNPLKDHLEVPGPHFEKR